VKKLSTALVAAFLAIGGPWSPADTTNTLVVANFGGGATELNGVAADAFDAGVTAAGGSGTWVSKPGGFQANGAILSTAGDAAAYLTLGSYINASKGTTSGKFLLSATYTVKPPTASWVSLGFFSNPTLTNSNFINLIGGLATIIYRSTSTGLSTFHIKNSPAGSSLAATGAQVVTVELDFTPAAGYNATSNHGKVRYFAGATQIGPTYTYAAAQSFLGLGMTTSSTPGGIGALTLKQVVPEAPVGALAEVRDGLTDIAVGATNDLGNVAVGGTLSRTYTVANNPAAGDTLYLTGNPAVVFAESGSTSYGGFTITTNVAGTATNLAAGSSTTFALQYDATQGVARHSATLSIANTHAARNPYTFKVNAGAYALAALPVLITEDFIGGAEDLHGSCAEGVNEALLTANGSPTWVAKSGVFHADGSITNGNSNTASLSLGSYLEAAKGTPAGKFWLSAVLSKPTGWADSWVSLGFFSTETPSVDGFFVNGGSGTMLYRSSGEVDAYAGGTFGTDNNIQGSLGLTGARQFTVELDLTPAGGYDGEANFGTVTFYEGTPDTANRIGSYTYTQARVIRALGVCISSGFSHSGIGALSLTTLPPPPPSSTVILIR